MVLEFQKEKQKQKMLISVLVVIVLVASVIVWYGYFQPEPVAPPVGEGVFNGAKNVDIDFATLESQELKDMELFTEISPFSGEIGKPDLFRLTGKLAQEVASPTENGVTPRP